MTRPLAFVTGAAQGIGRATALGFARAGYDVAVLDVLEDPLREVAAAIATAGGRADVHVVDLLDVERAQRAVAAAAATAGGRLDVLVNNAAWRELSTLREVSLDSWEKTLRVCLTAPAFLARAAAAVMERRRRGVIVNVSSINSIVTGGLAPAYSAAKGGINALTYDLASLFGRAGIRVVGVAPGAIDTELSRDYTAGDGASATAALKAYSESATPLGRWGTAEEVARAIVWLASDDASFITGTLLIADGGWSRNLLPYDIKHRLKPEEFP